VRVLTVEAGDLQALGVRKPTERQGEVRVIDVDGFDRSTCGGTHVRRSGEVGMIAVLGSERYKGGTRVEFVCGGRVLAFLRRDHELLRQLARIHSGAIDELPRLAEKALQERAALGKENARLQEEILDWEARALVPPAGPGGLVVVRRVFAGRSLEALKLLAHRAIAHGAGVVLLGSDGGQAVVARAPGAAGDCAAAVRTAVAAHGGKGGGKPDLAQAGGIAPGAIPAWLERAEAYVTAAPGVSPRPDGERR
jgi:alanyl-tRNA synthetase